MTTLRRVLAESAAAAAAPPRVAAPASTAVPASVASAGEPRGAASAAAAVPAAARRRTDSVERSRQRAKLKKPKAAASHIDAVVKRAAPTARAKPARAKPRMDDSVRVPRATCCASSGAVRAPAPVPLRGVLLCRLASPHVHLRSAAHSVLITHTPGLPCATRTCLQNDYVCGVCERPGDLLLCDGKHLIYCWCARSATPLIICPTRLPHLHTGPCLRSFHMECLKLPRTPGNKWECVDCRTNKVGPRQNAGRNAVTHLGRPILTPLRARRRAPAAHVLPVRQEGTKHTQVHRQKMRQVLPHQVCAPPGADTHARRLRVLLVPGTSMCPVPSCRVVSSQCNDTVFVLLRSTAAPIVASVCGHVTW